MDYSLTEISLKKLKVVINKIFAREGLLALSFLLSFHSFSCTNIYKSIEIYLQNKAFPYKLILSFPKACQGKFYTRMELESPSLKLIEASSDKVLREFKFKSGNYLESTKKIFLADLKTKNSQKFCLGQDNIFIDFKTGMVKSFGSNLYFDLSNGDTYNCKI